MDIYITEKQSGLRVGLSWLPKEVKQKGSAKYQSYDFISIGEVRLPDGTKLLTYSWNATFPGEALKNANYLRKQHWRSPKELVGIFEEWRQKNAVLILMVTETWINQEVTLSTINPTPTGGMGNVDYDISFTEHRDVVIKTVAELQGAAPAVQAASAVRAAPAAAAAQTYTVVRGDNLWAIAQRKLGNGARYGEIYDINKAVIGKSPDKIYAGQVLTLPG